jgi:3-dehydroquinate dehydratase I
MLIDAKKQMRISVETPLEMRGKQFGGPSALFCVPLVASSQEELLAQARTVSLLDADVVEWRADFFADLSQYGIAEAAANLRSICANAILLFTLRSKKEGGKNDGSPRERVSCFESAIRCGVFDLVDVELGSGLEVIDPVIAAAKMRNVRVILSFHDFEGTPANDALLEKVKSMIESGADIAKIACMPRDPEDALRLLEVTLAARRKFPSVPLCTMSMGEAGCEAGCITRVAGFLYGSDMAFAVGDKSSAPGQIPLQAARQITDTLLKYA